MALSVIFMAAAPDIHQLVQQVAVLEERMKSIDARYDQGWTLLREDIAKRDAMRAEEMAKRDVELARRDLANTRWLVGTIAGATAIIIGATALLTAG